MCYFQNVTSLTSKDVTNITATLFCTCAAHIWNHRREGTLMMQHMRLSLKVWLHISVTPPHSNLDHSSFSAVHFWAGFFFCQSGEGPCLYRSSYLEPVIINKAGSISSLIVDETPNHRWYHRTAISPVVPDRPGWGFFSTQSWVGQENSSDEPQTLLLCSELPTDPLGLPHLQTPAPQPQGLPATPPKGFPSSLPSWLVMDSSSALGVPGLQKGRESSLS